MSDSTYAEAISAHYSEKWSAPTRAFRWEKGPIDDLPQDFRVLLLNRATDMQAFATRCMSQPIDRERVEVHVLCRPEDAHRTDLVEILTAVAHYHRTQANLGLGHSVNFGKPWIAGSTCTHGVLSLPYLDGPDLEWLQEPKVRFLWLIPVTQAEVQFKKARGMEALEQRFEEAQFNFLDPFRASVA